MRCLLRAVPLQLYGRVSPQQREGAGSSSSAARMARGGHVHCIVETARHMVVLTSACTVYAAELLPMCAPALALCRSRAMHASACSQTLDSALRELHCGSFHPQYSIWMFDHQCMSSQTKRNISAPWLRAHALLVQQASTPKPVCQGSGTAQSTDPDAAAGATAQAASLTSLTSQRVPTRSRGQRNTCAYA